MYKGVYVLILKKNIRAVFEVFPVCLTPFLVYRFSTNSGNIIYTFIWYCVYNLVFLSELFFEM